MKKFLQKRLKNEKGLTLVELLAVIVILGIIAAIAIPSIGNIVTNSKVNALKADAQNVLAAANMYFIEADTEDGTVDQDTLISEGFLEDAGGFAVVGADEATVSKGEEGAGNTISGIAVNGDVSVEFDGATNANITAAKVKDGGDNVTVNR